ncbi:ribulose-5-phosphate 4-epimerase/fuculose-1-phosphate aldolase [Natronocella acetinitrilica]|uniref:Ribulose-5-phosphate 4-epimerase/fuculose-1-phosphate aldolase n=1 Tax=Natronocella acetinitrilica TaxID=414046 RepID=A0AAE3KC23_9GAMM|nr:class II aldolase/adducin family protein [Natronocella acetinitrilica]MCP1675274.1 ribulose-5-phosphate 4-epimerase/fuculose-1-phosphate aldolase [Natronocella acetinitrilica]
MSGEREGVIRYQCRLDRRALPDDAAALAEINRWREDMLRRGWMGRDPGRYEGLGFGNISLRRADGFLVSATQTGGLPTLAMTNLALVTGAEPHRNRLTAVGLAEPSSEAMTHAAVYLAEPGAGGIIHVHAPALWNAASTIGIPVTAASIPYGTPEMAAAIAALATAGHHLMAMGGHEDGLLAWDDTLEQAAAHLIHAAETPSAYR